jgi:3-oxoadipate enol-lactonase
MTSLAFREWGDPKGLPVLLLHAFPMSGGMWEPQREALRAFRAIAPDFPGFGATPLSGAWTIESAADALAALLDQLGVSRAAVVGLSMGGYAALRLAAAHPGKVRALALCDTRSEADAPENKLKRKAAADFVRQHGVDAFLGPFLKDAVRNQDAAAFLRGVAARSTPEAVIAALSALAERPDATPGLSRITVPTAVIVGGHDKITPLPLSEAMRSRVPGAELHLIPDAGHFSNAENPAAFNERLLSFLRRLPLP